MGQEPYTLAILLAERMGYFAFNNLRIDATDIDPDGRFEAAVCAGTYAKEQLGRLPEGVLEKYFEPDGAPDCYRVVERVRRRVTFRRHDLLSFQEIGHGYSLVLCKNVLLHFEPAARVEVIRMFHRALAPEGLFATEQTQTLPGELAGLFEKVAQHVPLYRKREGEA